MNSPLPASGPGQRRNWTRLLVNLFVALVVVAVAAATFVFSYDGVHAIALLGGVSKQLARYYPGLFDAVLVIACVAAVMLRNGSWWARLWAWFVIFILLAAIGTTDVLHATNYTLRHRPTEGIVAAAPVVAVLLAFSLLLALLRQSRTHAPEPAEPPTVEIPALPAAFTGAPIALPAAPGPDDQAPDDQAPTVEVPAFVPVPPAPPTVQVPSLSQRSEAVPPPPGAPPTGSAPGRGIRYAGSDVPGMAGKPPAEEPDEPDEAQREDYWESEEDGQYAGLVYNAPDEHDEHQDSDDSDDGSDDSDGAGGAGDSDDSGDDESAARATPAEVDDDAPPFATAPFASVPRLNRVRSTPTPPADEDE